MKWLLDTCTISDFARSHPSVLLRVKAAIPDDVAVSTVSLMEIEYGLRGKPAVARRLRPVLDALLGSVHRLPYGESEARRTAELRVGLKKAGRPIGAYDALIAGTALAHDLVLVTSNTGEFSQVEGLVLEDWRMDPDRVGEAGTPYRKGRHRGRAAG